MVSNSCIYGFNWHQTRLWWLVVAAFPRVPVLLPGNQPITSCEAAPRLLNAGATFWLYDDESGGLNLLVRLLNIREVDVMVD